MSQLKLLPGGPGELSVDFLGHRCRAATVDGVTFLAAVDVGEALSLAGNGETVTRWLPDQEKGAASFRTPGGNQSMAGVTMEGAMMLALSRRRGAPGGIRERLDAAMVALGTGDTPPAAPDVTALHAKIDALTALVRAIPASGPQTEDVARAVAVALETWEAGKYKRRSDAIKAGHARAVAAGWDPRKPAQPKRPAVTEADVLAALRQEMDPVSADVLAKRHRWSRAPVRVLLVALEKAGRVEYRHRRHEQGWRVRPEVV